MDDYVVFVTKGYPACRGCKTEIQPGTLRIAIAAKGPQLENPYKVQVSYSITNY
jgi:hypothetical protein